MKLPRLYIVIATFVAGIIIILAYFFLLQRPLNAKVKKLILTKESLLENEVSINSIRQNLAQLNQKRSLLQKEINSLESDFANSQSPWNIMQNAGNISKKLNLYLDLIHPTICEKNDNYQHSSLLIKVKGDFLTFYRFLYLLEQCAPNLKADSLTIDVDTELKQYREEIIFDLFTPIKG